MMFRFPSGAGALSSHRESESLMTGVARAVNAVRRLGTREDERFVFLKEEDDRLLRGKQ
jgi:hypothetical protein